MTSPEVSSGRVRTLSVASILLFAYYIERLGFQNLFTNRLALDAIRQTVWQDSTSAAIITSAVQMGLLVSVIAQLQLRRRLKTIGKPWPLLLFTITLTCLLIAVNPVSTPRYVFGTAVLALLAALGGVRSLKRFRLLSGGAVVGMIYVFPVADMFRSSVNPSLKSQNPLQSMLSGDFDSYSQIVNTVEYVHNVGYSLGQQLLGVIFFWIPRSMWANKPIDTGSLIGAFKNYGFTNLSEPLWGELFINGSWILTVVGMVAVGFALRRLDRRGEDHLSFTGIPSVLGCILPFYLIIVFRGSLLQSMAGLSLVVLLYLLIRKSPSRDISSSAREVRESSE